MVRTLYRLTGLAGSTLLAAALCGCTMCHNCSDYTPPVLGGPADGAFYPGESAGVAVEGAVEDGTIVYD